MEEKRFLGFKQEIRINPKLSHLFYVSDEKEPESEIPVIKRKSISTSQLIKKIDAQTGDNILLPPNCRYIERTKDGWSVLIEEQPSIRTVSFDRDLTRDYDQLKKEGLDPDVYAAFNPYKLSSRSKQVLSLAFPYVVFALHITNSYYCSVGQVFARPAPIFGMSDQLFKLPTSNISQDQYICFGSHGGTRQRSLLEAIQHIIMVFWSAHFNSDYQYNYSAYGKEGEVVGNVFRWEYETRNNPMFIYDVKWLPHSENVNQLLAHLKSYVNGSSRSGSGLTYSQLEHLFTGYLDTGKKESVGRRKTEHNLFYDICQGTYLDAQLYLSVGDVIKNHKGEDMFVDTFIGFMDGGTIQYVCLDKNGQKYMLKYNSKTIKFLTENVKKQRYLETYTLEDGNVLKAGDLFKIQTPQGERYFKAEYIRKSRNEDDPDAVEIKARGGYFMPQHVKIEKIDKPELKINGEALKEGDQIFINHHGGQGLIIGVSQYKYDGYQLNEDSNGVITYMFGNRSGIHRVGPPYDVSSFTRVEKMNYLPQTFRFGKRVYRPKDKDYDKPSNKAAWFSADGKLMYDSAGIYLNGSFSATELMNEFVTSDKFTCSGEHDISFEIGDKVVVADWRDPINILNIKTITGFKAPAEGGVSFILMDKENNLSEQLYVTATGYINVGMIRKVDTKFGKLKNGMKIIAKESGYSAFPKKDVNIIVAFLIDSPYEPQVLCSNGCTLWYSDVLRDFTKILMTSKKWATLDHVPLDVSKIKYQHGDLVNGKDIYFREGGYILAKPDNYQSIRAIPIDVYCSNHYDSYPFTKDVQNDFIYECIPAPRYTAAQIKEMLEKSAPDFNGGGLGVHQSPSSPYSFIIPRFGESAAKTTVEEPEEPEEVSKETEEKGQ